MPFVLCCLTHSSSVHAPTHYVQKQTLSMLSVCLHAGAPVWLQVLIRFKQLCHRPFYCSPLSPIPSRCCHQRSVWGWFRYCVHLSQFCLSATQPRTTTGTYMYMSHSQSGHSVVAAALVYWLHPLQNHP